MKKLLLVPILFFCACCPIDKAVVSKALKEVEQTDQKIDKKFMQYINADPVMDSDSKDDYQKLIDSRNRILQSIKKGVE